MCIRDRYLHDLASGKLKRQITRGDWNAAKIVRIDPATRTVWFEGVGREAGRDPYFSHLYKASLDGGAVHLLTPEDADHKVQLSDDGRFFVDTYSTSSAPPVTVLRRLDDGAEVKEIARADIKRLEATGWHPPEKFTVKGRDGKTDAYGLMWKPSNFDASKQYPIINYIYPGPQGGSVGSRQFSAATRDNQALAELGFIVVAIDGTGTVSYTHLDVYKRQEPARANGRPAARPGGRPPEHVSPDGKTAAFIRDWNLWVRDVATNKETQVTTDGVKDFGYATDNAGWIHSDRAILTWSPDSKKLATFQQEDVYKRQEPRA